MRRTIYLVGHFCLEPKSVAFVDSLRVSNNASGIYALLLNQELSGGYSVLPLFVTIIRLKATHDEGALIFGQGIISCVNRDSRKLAIDDRLDVLL